MSLILSGTDGLSDVDGSAATPAIRGTDANTGIFFPAADTLGMSTGGSERVRVDSSGNVGIGVTPNTWNTFTSNIQGSGYALSGFGATGNTQTVLSTNAYYNTGWKYVQSGTTAATQYLQINGAHTWSYAAGGTAGNAITFTEAMRIDTSGNLLVGTTSAFTGTYAVNIMGATSSRAYFGLKRETASTTGVCGSIQTFNGANNIASIDFQANGANNSGYIATYTWSAGSAVQGPYVNTGGVSWTTASDETLKDIIAPIEDATSKLSGLRTVFGKYKTDHDDVRRIFLIAQDVQAVLPEAVSTDGSGKLGLNYQDIVPVLVAAIKEQQALIQSLTDRITALETP